jgi:hypothetical protein
VRCNYTSGAYPALPTTDRSSDCKRLRNANCAPEPLNLRCNRKRSRELIADNFIIGAFGMGGSFANIIGD